MISYDKKFIFIHINKTAGTSIEQALNSYGEKRIVPKNNTDFKMSRQSQHFNYKEYREFLGADYDDYFKFTVIRNPFDRIVSYYFGRNAITNGLNFSEWIVDRYKNRNFQDFERMYSDYKHWIGEEKMDLILRFENLSSDFEILKEKLNLNCELGFHNVTKNRVHYSKYYNDETRAIVKEFFRDEIKKFNYTFEEK